MSYNARRVLPSSASRKRKEMEPFVPSTSSKPLVKSASVSHPVSFDRGATTPFEQTEPRKPVSSNRLLAGYMAHEFLTKGTLFGEKFDPARAEAVPVGKNSATHGSQPKPNGYAEVANILKTDGAHVPGVVNPTQLAKWIRDAKDVLGSSQSK